MHGEGEGGAGGDSGETHDCCGQELFEWFDAWGMDWIEGRSKIQGCRVKVLRRDRMKLVII